MISGVEPKSEDDRNIVVKQYYPFKTRGVQQCEAARVNAMREASRVINTDGTVVKIMEDGTTQVILCGKKSTFKYVFLKI